MFGLPYRTVLGTVGLRGRYHVFLVHGKFNFSLNPFNKAPLSTLMQNILNGLQTQAKGTGNFSCPGQP